MIAQHRGAILNVSSSAGFLPIPGSAVYAATKAYVTSFSEALRAELRGTGVSVCALCPGPVVTEFQQVAKREGMKPDIGPKFIVVTVEQVVRDALAALEADRPLIIPGFAMKLLMLLARLMPMPVLRWVARCRGGAENAAQLQHGLAMKSVARWVGFRTNIAPITCSSAGKDLHVVAVDVQHLCAALNSSAISHVLM